MEARRTDESKKCSVCGVVKERSEYDVSDARGYLRCRCKQCDRAYAKARRDAKRAADPLPPPQAHSELPRVCVQCGVEKPIAEFPWADKKRGFHRRRCGPCYSTFKKPITERYAAKNRDKILDAHRDYHALHREARNRARIQRYNETPVEVRRKRRVMQQYGISGEAYDALIAPGVCAICGAAESRTSTGKRKGLAVDHCHTSGRPRGLLCNNCNTGIGWFEEDPERLRAAIGYLALHADG